MEGGYYHSTEAFDEGILRRQTEKQENKGSVGGTKIEG